MSAKGTVSPSERPIMASLIVRGFAEEEVSAVEGLRVGSGAALGQFLRGQVPGRRGVVAGSGEGKRRCFRARNIGGGVVGEVVGSDYGVMP